MKPLITTQNFFNCPDKLINQSQPLCRNGLNESLSPWSWFLRSLSSLRQQIQNHRLRYATPGCLAGNITTTLKEAMTNNRVFAGIVLLMVAPCFWWTHLFFDWNTVVPGWYYKNWFFWFFTNREELTFGLGLTGFFLLCQQKWGYRYLLVPVVGLCVSEIIYQSFQINHWTHFYRPMWAPERSWQVLAIVPLIVLAIWKAIDYTVYRKYHLKDGTAARVIGVVKTPGLSVEEKMNIMERLVAESEGFNARV